MTRLTGWDKESAYYLKCFEGKKGGCKNMESDKCFKCQDSYEACKRLAEYEDSELTPEQIIEAKSAIKSALGLACKIKAQQQEIKGWESRYQELDTGHGKLFKDFCKLKQENEELRDYKNHIDNRHLDDVEKLQEINGLNGNNKILSDSCHIWRQKHEKQQQHIQQLQAQNGVMREALAKARTTLQTLNYLGGLGYDKHIWISEALATIDKAGGGEE